MVFYLIGILQQKKKENEIKKDLGDNLFSGTISNTATG